MSRAFFDDPRQLAPRRTVRTELGNGAFTLHHPDPLDPYARCVGEWLERWALDKPDAAAFAEPAEGGWNTLSWAALRQRTGAADCACAIAGDATAPAAMPAGMSAPGGMPGGFAAPPPPGAMDDKVGRIAAAQQVVARDPKNVQAWIQLGNDLFDTNQHQRSIEAYAKALELQPNNPDVLTDQGVMYRATGQFDKAIANFEKAQKVAPTHLQSLINIAVVYDSDLKQTSKAVAALEKVLQIDPTGQFGAQAREFLAQIKARSAAK